MKPREWMCALAVSAGLMCSSSFGQITGTVNFEGEEPEPEQIEAIAGVKDCAQHHPDGLYDESVVVVDGKLANVVVSIKPAEGAELSGPVPKKPVKLDQVGCQYVPHVVAVMVNQPFIVANSDPFLHNVHSLAIDNPAFNFAQPNKDPGKKIAPMKTAERYKIKCDVHPWMSAFVSVFEHPFFAVSTEEGTFEIPTKGLEDGTYTLVAWHETLGEQEIEIEVTDGKAEEAEFTFSADGEAAADPVEGTDVALASFEAKGEKKACDRCPKAKGKTLAKAK